jgi:hypothetical protein
MDLFFQPTNIYWACVYIKYCTRSWRYSSKQMVRHPGPYIAGVEKRQFKWPNKKIHGMSAWWNVNRNGEWGVPEQRLAREGLLYKVSFEQTPGGEGGGYMDSWGKSILGRWKTEAKILEVGDCLGPGGVSVTVVEEWERREDKVRMTGERLWVQWSYWKNLGEKQTIGGLFCRGMSWPDLHSGRITLLLGQQWISGV